MSLWWMWGGSPVPVADPGTPPPPGDEGAALRLAPALWSGGVRWGDTAAPFGDGTDAYWSYATVPLRTGKPALAVAIAGGLVLEQLNRASFSLGRPDWLSTLTPTTASFEFVDVPAAAVNDTIVVALMSDATEYHSDPLWVGRVTDVSTRRDLDGFTYSTISATDIIGVLGQARAPESIAAGYTLKTLVERLATDAGVSLQVDTDPLVTLPTLTAAADIDGTVLDLVNRAERSSNALLFLRGNGRLYAAMRDSTGASSVRVVDLDGANSPSGWAESKSLRGVVTRWKLGDGNLWSTDTPTTTLDTYGEQAYSATDLLITDPAPYANLIASDVMSYPRAVLVDAPFPITDLGQDVLFLDPLDRVSADGVTWQVMSVQHEVTLDEWRVSITADATQEALAGAPEPGPVTPPTLHTVTQVYTSTKGATMELTSGGTKTGTSLGDLNMGRFSNGSRYRAAVEWAIVPPANAIDVVSASVRFKTATTTTNGRVELRTITDSWTEGTLDWPGTRTNSEGERRFDVPKAAGKYVSASITAMARWWWRHENNGLRIASINEDSVDRRAVFMSDDSSNAEDRPRLTITWEVVS